MPTQSSFCLYAAQMTFSGDEVSDSSSQSEQCLKRASKAVNNSEHLINYFYPQFHGLTLKTEKLYVSIGALDT